MTRTFSSRLVAPFGMQADPHLATRLLILVTSSAIGTLLLVAALVPLPSLSAGSSFLLLLSMGACYYDGARSCVRRCLELIVPEREAPALHLSDPAIDHERVVVAISMLLGSRPQLREFFTQLDRLAVNLETSNVLLAILSDWRDSAVADPDPNEERRLAVLKRGVGIWNRDPSRLRLVVLHRPRMLSADQAMWIGAGRKAGKIQSLVELLAEGTGVFGSQATALGVFLESRFILALDEDTLITGASLRALLAVALKEQASSHDGGQIRWGIFGAHTVRSTSSGGVTHDLLDAPAHLHDVGGRDLNFDLFGERAFTGKGLIAVERFRKSTRSLTPHYDSLLSHDTIEGALAGCCHVSRALFRDHGSQRLDGLIRRRERWIRGDAQNAIHILTGHLDGDALTPFGRRLVFENVRRSTTPLACVLALLSAVSLPSPYSWYWLFVALSWPVVTMLPFAVLLLVQRWRRGLLLFRPFQTLTGIFGGMRLHVRWLCLLPTLAWVTLAALFRAASRSWKGRGLIDWTSSASSVRDDPRIGRARLALLSAPATSAILAIILADDTSVGISFLLAVPWILAAILPMMRPRLDTSNS